MDLCYQMRRLTAGAYVAASIMGGLWGACTFSTTALAWEGLATHGSAKYKQGFSHLGYADAQAVRGGELVLGMAGDFDSLNTFSNKGLAPLLLPNLIYQSLGQSTLDEPFSQYPELAESFTVAADRLSMTVKLRADAKFADGKPLTTADVAFSFDLFRSDKVDALYKTYWADIKELKVQDAQTFSFIFAKENYELPAIATQLTVLPKHFYGSGDYNRDFNDKALGSGPYEVADFKRGAFITYRRNAQFWAAADPFNKGRYNFDKITVKYYKDPTAQVEAFKKGEFDLFMVNSSKVWAKDLTGERFERLGWIAKELWPHQNNQGSQGFFFNLRRKALSDLRVRQAIALAFDFEWTNATLFYGQYTENKSFFENSEFKARGLPDEAERQILAPLQAKFRDEVPAAVLEQPMGSLAASGPFKERLKIAQNLLKEAGYSLRDGVMTAPDGTALKFSFLLDGQVMQRVVEPFVKNLSRIGVKVSMDVKEDSVYQRKLQARDFDLVILTVAQSQSPGNEQIDFWHSSTATTEYSRNHYGLSNKAVDALVDKIIYAKTREELVLNTRALDRLLYHLHIAVQNWHSQGHRVALWRKFAQPKDFPLYYSPLTFLEFLWWDEAKAKKLKASMQGNTPL